MHIYCFQTIYPAVGERRTGQVDHSGGVHYTNETVQIIMLSFLIMLHLIEFSCHIDGKEVGSEGYGFQGDGL